jgi:four helix bundle protein
MSVRSLGQSAASYEDLIVWQRGIELAKDVYRITAMLPREERFGLSDQMKRAAVSVPANIAEGASRGHTREFLRYLSIAKGSLAEVRTYLVLINQLEFLPRSELLEAAGMSDEIGKMINALQASLKKKLAKPKQTADSLSSQSRRNSEKTSH